MGWETGYVVQSPPPRGGRRTYAHVPNEKPTSRRLVPPQSWDCGDRLSPPLPGSRPRLGPWLLSCPFSNHSPAALLRIPRTGSNSFCFLSPNCAMLTRPRRERGPACAAERRRTRGVSPVTRPLRAGPRSRNGFSIPSQDQPPPWLRAAWRSVRWSAVCSSVPLWPVGWADWDERKGDAKTLCSNLQHGK